LELSLDIIELELASDLGNKLNRFAEISTFIWKKLD